MTDTASGRKLRVGVLGCGPIAQAAHFESCRKARNAELFAICDVSDELLARIRDIRIGAFFAADLKEGVAAFASKRTPTFTWPAKPS
jgi:predicted dehydrogenase